ncbi:MAG: DNA repair protein RecO, partial [Alphaproteobacteria bacterium]
MEWHDSGVVLSTRAHGEASVIVELLTNAHGRHLGLVRGGRSARLRATLQAGNAVQATWRARLDEHLGQFTLELETARAATLMQDRARLAGLGTLAALAHLLPEREPVPGIVARLTGTLDLMMTEETQQSDWLAEMVRFELALLNELGFGLDLSECASSGQTHDLV